MERRPTRTRTTLSVSVIVLLFSLTTTVLLAQDNPEAVILTDEEFQALLAAGGDTPVGTILTDEQFEVLTVFLDADQG